MKKAFSLTKLYTDTANKYEKKKETPKNLLKNLFTFGQGNNGVRCECRRRFDERRRIEIRRTNQNVLCATDYIVILP